MFGHATYLVLEIAWGMPVVGLQWLAGYRILRHNLRALATGLAVMTAYLVCADGIAITTGIWTLHSNRIVGLYVADVPVEEIIFFLLTNAMVMQTVILVLAGWHPARRGGTMDESRRPMQTLDIS